MLFAISSFGIPRILQQIAHKSWYCFAPNGSLQPICDPVRGCSAYSCNHDADPCTRILGRLKEKNFTTRSQRRSPRSSARRNRNTTPDKNPDRNPDQHRRLNRHPNPNRNPNLDHHNHRRRPLDHRRLLLSAHTRSNRSLAVAGWDGSRFH